MNEIWKDIKDYEGLYQVSNLGRVKRILFINNKFIKKENKILKIQTNKFNRQYISLYKNNKRKNCTVHRLVAKAFIPNPNNLPEINHIDGNPSNNNVKNLEWCTASYNCKHAYQNGLNEKFKKYNESRKKAIKRSDGKVYSCIYEAIKELNVKSCSLRDALKGRTKTCKGYTWRYVDD